MLASVNNWYAITGGNASGKTTLITILAKRGYNVVHESARMLIDQAVARGITSAELRTDEAKFQEDVMRLKAELERQTDPQQLTFFDRGMHDTLAYDRYYGYPQQDWVKELIAKSRYKKVFILDTLPQYEADYSRIEDAEFAKKIAEFQYQAYADYGMEPIRVPVLATPEARADFVLKIVEADQKVL